MLTGRIDAIWVHDGYLDARDYKTGRLHFEQTGSDLTARAQAWLLEPLANRDGLALRVRHEYLAEEIDQQPDVFEPEAADLEDIGGEISQIAEEMFLSDFAGVSEPVACGWCSYSESCPDSALLDDETVISVVEPND